MFGPYVISLPFLFVSAVRLGDADEVVHTQAVNQIEAHPLLLQDDLVNYCKEHNIHIAAYSPLGNNSASFLSSRSLAVSDRGRFGQWLATRS